MAKDKQDTTKKTLALFQNSESLSSAVRTMDDLDNQDVHIPTDSLIYDIYLGGGFSPGLSRFVGEPEHGKTAQALIWAKNWLNHYGDKGRVVYFDCEGRMSSKKLRASKIDRIPDVKERLFFVRQNLFDDIATTIRNLINENEEGLHYFFVFDSLDMLITKANLEKSFSEAEKVGAAQVMSTLLMKHVGPYLQDRGHHLMVLSQIRANINVNNPNSPKTKMSGANALRHAANIIGEIIKNYTDMFIFENPMGKTMKEKGGVIGHYFTIRFTKTMNEKSGRTIRIPIRRGYGIWREREVTDLALEHSQIAKKGGWFELTNTDWIKRINEDLTIKVREKTVTDGVANAVAEAEKAGTALSKSQIKEVTATLTKAAELLNFEVETKWQGYENVFNYISSNPLLVDWMDKEFRATLISDSVGTVNADDITFD